LSQRQPGGLDLSRRSSRCNALAQADETLGLLLRTLLLAPLALRLRGEIAARWRERRAAIIAIGVLSPLGLHARAAGAADRTAELRCARARGVHVGRHAAGRTPVDERVRPAQAAGTATMLLGVVAIARA